MAVLAVGFHHRSTPLDLLGDLSVGPLELPKVLARVVDSGDVREAVVLSTCQRIEVVADVARFHDAVQHVRDVLAAHSGRTAGDLAPYLTTWYDDGAAAHLFAVAAGLDSIVVGESEVLSQVKQAASAAESEGTLGRALRPLFRHALEAAKRVRRETGIARQAASVASAAVALVREVADFAGQSVAVVGAGQAAAGAARALLAAGAAEIVVVNRTATAGEELAAEVNGRRVPFEQLPEVLREVAVVLCSTAAPQPVLTPVIVASAMAGRAGRPLALVDIALPRDVHPDVRHVPGVSVIDLDDLQSRASEGMARRRAEIGRGEDIVADEVERSAVMAGSTLRSQAETIAAGEMARRQRRLTSLDDDTRTEVEALVRAVVRKILHAPTAALRTHAADPEAASLVEAAAVLFDLDLE
jgi:glutamyl-tRNA reductase